MPRIFFAIIALLISYQSAYASQTAQRTPIWVCYISATLFGDSKFYWREVRDAWQGPGKINCSKPESPDQKWTLLMTVRFESSNPTGLGALPESSFMINSLSILTDFPYNLAQRIEVEDRNSDKGIWYTENNEMTFVRSNEQEGFASSLKSGILEIHFEILSDRPSDREDR